MEALKKEFELVKKNSFSLNFCYPTEEQKKLLNIVNRDMTEEERHRVHKKKGDVAQLLEDLESGRIYPEDLGAEQVKRLRALLARGQDNADS